MARMEQNGTRFTWDARRQRCAQLLAEDDLTDEEIAKKAGCSRTQLSRWKTNPVFQARVKELIAKLGDVAFRRELARRSRRLALLESRSRKLRQVIEERAADPKMKGVPGGQTGLLVHTKKALGSGVAMQIVDEYTLDTGLLSAMLQIEKQAAIESGQWDEDRKVTATIDLTSGGKPLERNSLSAADIAAAAALVELAGVGVSEDSGAKPVDQGRAASQAKAAAPSR